MKYKPLLLILFWTILFGGLQAQIDTEFWFAAPDITTGHGHHPILLCFASFGQAADVTVSQPANPSFQPITVHLNNFDFYSLDMTSYESILETAPENTITNYGLKIVSTSKISTYYQLCGDDSEIYTLKGRNALGTHFIVPMQNTLPLGDYYPEARNSIEIVATQDNTTVTIIPSNAVSGNTANPIVVTLNAGQTYSIRSVDTQESSHLGNTVIISDKPIAVNSTDDSVAYYTGAQDLAADQIVPVDYAGNLFAAIWSETSYDYETVTIFPTENNTQIFINGATTPVATINVGGQYIYHHSTDMSTPITMISTSKPVLVWQLSGYSSEIGATQLPALECTGSRDVVYGRPDNSYNIVAYILTETANIQNFSVQCSNPSASLTAADFTQVPFNTAWSYCYRDFTSDVNNGSVIRISNSSGKFHLGILDYAGSTTSLGYFCAYNNGGRIVFTQDEEHCPHSNFTLTYYADDADSIRFITPAGIVLFQDSLTINNFSPADTGMYYIRALSTMGCDSLVWLTDSIRLSINSAGGDTIHVQHSQCDSYTWNGVTYDTSGVFMQTLTASSGCDSVVMLHLTILPPPTIYHTPDTTIQAGDTATLWASGTDILYWTDANGNILSTTPYLTVSPVISTTYYITGQNLEANMSENVVVNGDFEQGNVNFYSELPFYPPSYGCLTWGSYTITSDGLSIWGSDPLFGYGGAGQFMIIDGSETPNAILWQQTVPVTPNTYYAFSAQVASTNDSYNQDSWALLQFSVNGTQLGPIFHSPNVLNTWQPYYEVWYSGNNTSATLTILNQNNNGYGNDFGLDAIVFAPLTTCTANDSVYVHLPEFPDNVDSADCTVSSIGHDWGIVLDWSSEEMVSPLVIPLVGDIDGDQVPEIVCLAPNDGYSFYGSTQVMVFNSLSHQLIHTINLPDRISTVDAAPYGIIKLPNGHVILVVVLMDYTMHAYDLTISGTSPLWSTTTGHNAPNVSFSDFNSDTYPEIYIGNKIYDAETGALLISDPSITNSAAAFSHISMDGQLAMASPCVADIVGDNRPDLILGNEIYEVQISNRNGLVGNSITLSKNITPPAGISIDGHPQVADFNLDGYLDVLISNKDNEFGDVGVYVWDVYHNTVSAPLLFATEDNGKSIPLIADIDGDNLLELVIQCNATTGEKVKCYKYDPTANSFSFMWDIYVDEDSYSNSMSVFDLNNDGVMDMLISDQTTVRIVNGSGHSHLTGNDTIPVYELTSLSFGECTVMQYPIVADVDADGSAELLVLGLFGSGHTYQAFLNVFKSASLPWAPARKVWNQYMYNVTNVNEDLTVPQYLFNNATPFTDPQGVVRRPYNNFLQQATTIDQYGRPFYAVPDVAVNNAATQIVGDTLLLSFSYCNLGDNTLNAPYPVTVFLNAYGDDTLCTALVNNSLPKDSCVQNEIHLPLSALCNLPIVDSLIFAVNGNSLGIAQNGGLQPECDITNNTTSVAIHIVPQTDTNYIVVHACDTLTWNGVTYDTSGVYMQTLANMFGCDSVVVMDLTVDPSSLTLFSDSVCQNSTYSGYGFSLSEDETTVSGLNTFDRTISNQFGCDSIIRLNLYVKPVITPVFYADPDKALLSENPVIHFINNTNTAEIAQSDYYWIWDFGDGASDTTTEANTEHLYSQWGDYTVTLTLWADGCTAFDTISVFIEADLVFPNVITPNGDGVNDVFAIKDMNPDRPNRLYITDRWGKTVWNQKNYQTYMKDEQIYNAESGFGTKDISDGVYYFTFYYEGLVRTIKFNGSITVIR